MTNILLRFVRHKSGVTGIEYALIASALAVVLFGAMAVIRPALAGSYALIAGSLS
jgi:Flp pilus assembly pilin Flp